MLFLFINLFNLLINMHYLFMEFISNFLLKCGIYAQNSKSHFVYISAVSEPMLLKIYFEKHHTNLQRIISDSCFQFEISDLM